MIKRLLKQFSKASERLAADSRWQHNRKRHSRNRDFLHSPNTNPVHNPPTQSCGKPSLETGARKIL
jgi:hypothetical protein